MKLLLLGCLVLALAACRGENPPRDYQNNPPAMTHPPQSKAESPAEKGMAQPKPEQSTGAEGTAAPYEPATTTTADTPPVTKTHT